MSESNVIFEDGLYRFKCPHCNGVVEVLQNQINCKIFRHATYKKDGQQIGPHTKQHECDSLVENDEVYGCTKPFQIRELPNKQWMVEVCDYI